MIEKNQAWAKFECPCGFRYELPCTKLTEDTVSLPLFTEEDGACPQCKGTGAVLKETLVEV